jgi:methylase of polypeptide subunit release factors
MIDCTDLFSELNPRERTKELIKIDAPEYTYLPEGEVVEGWLPKVMRGFQTYKHQVVKMETAAIVGCGPGVDALLMLEILNPQRLVLTDVDQRIVEVAMRNVRDNCKIGIDQIVQGTHGDLCEGLLVRGSTFDLVYENLPNLPAKSAINVTQGALSASFFDDTKYHQIPDKFASNLLGLHYEFLRQAKGCLKEGGDVLCCIGARVPLSLIFEMFESLDYMPEVLVQDLVRQFEAERVLAEYSRIESESKNRFWFFDLDMALPHFKKLNNEGLEPSKLMDRLAKEAPAIAAEEAAWRHGLGGRVGVVGLMIRGRSIV